VTVRQSAGASAVSARLTRAHRTYGVGSGSVRGGRASVRLGVRALTRGNYVLSVVISGPGGATHWQIPVIIT
jgi:hypothetical protein